MFTDSGTCQCGHKIVGERKIKRTKGEDLSLPDRTWDVIMGLDDADQLLLGAIGDDRAHIVFYTAEAQALRIDASTVNPQQTGSASGVVGVKVRDDDKLLGAVLVPEGEKDEAMYQIVVASETGYVHRFPLSEVSVKGRGSMGVRCLRASKSTGKLGALAIGREDESIDLYLADGRRYHRTIKDLPATSRDVQGDQLIKDAKKQPVVQAVVLR